MPFVLLILAAVCLVLLIICIYSLITMFGGWRHRYPASITQMIVNIPQPGKYSICSVRRIRRMLGIAFSSGFPKVSFSIANKNTQEVIGYFPEVSLSASQGISKITRRVGYFHAPSADEYLIVSHPESQFMPNEEILVRKYVSTVRIVLAILGVTMSAIMFLTFLVLGLIFLFI